MRYFLFCLLGFTSLPAGLRAQDADFCDAVNTIVADGPNQFRNIRGKKTGENVSATTWETGIKVPGSIGARFVASLGLFYESAFIQTKDKEAAGKTYQQYKQTLTNCLAPQGYSTSLQPNFFPGMADYKKVVFMPKPSPADTTPPSHITLEATYNKTVGLYTVVMYIFEH